MYQALAKTLMGLPSGLFNSKEIVTRTQMEKRAQLFLE
jgi:hypothetical protein